MKTAMKGFSAAFLVLLFPCLTQGNPAQYANFSTAQRDAFVTKDFSYVIADLERLANKRVEDLQQKSDLMSIQLESCQSEFADLISGQTGFQVSGEIVDCAFLKKTKERIEFYSNRYPKVILEAFSSPGGQFHFEFQLKRYYRFAEAHPTGLDLELNGRSNIEFIASGWGIGLSVSYIYVDRTSSARNGKWAHYLRYDLPTRAKPGELTAEDLGPQLDALIASFFAETEAILYPTRKETLKEEELSKPLHEFEHKNVRVTFHSAKLETGIPQFPFFHMRHYFKPLINDVMEYFEDPATVLPEEVGSMRIHLMHSSFRTFASLISPAVDRHNPSLYGPSFPGDKATIVGYFEVYDHKGEKLIYMVQNGPGNVRERNMGYIDTIPLPYKKGLFQIMMKRVMAEISTTLRTDRPSRADYKNSSWDLGPIKETTP